MLITERNRKWWIFFGMAAALSVVYLDQTAISVALPAIQKDLVISDVMLQWVINAYLVSIAAIVVFGGKLGDTIGHKKTFIIGILLFTFSSVGCGLATSSLWIILSRAIQGIGAAFMIPVTGVMIAHAFSETERGKAMGLYIAVASVFLTLGPLLSGTLVHYLSWRWVFWINVPISFVSILLALFAVPASEDRPVSFKSLDWIGLTTFSIFITSLVIALMEGVNLGWKSPEIIVLFLLAIVFAIGFFYNELKAPDPMIYLPLFKERNFLGANLCLLLFTAAFSCSVFWAILLQDVMGYSPVSTGLFYLPVTLPVMFMAPFGGMLRDNYGPRLPTIIGSLIVAIGSAWIALTVFKEHYSAMLPGFILFGLGPSLIYSSVMATTLSSAPLPKMGMASGISNGIRQVGRVLGVAMIGSVISNIEYYKLKHAGLSGLHKHHLTSALTDATSSQLKTIFTFAFSISMAFTCLLILLTLAAAFLLPNKPLVLKGAQKNKIASSLD